MRTAPLIFLSWLLLLPLPSGAVPGGPSSASTTERTDAPRSHSTPPLDTIDLGVVWRPPSDPEAALQALRRIDVHGATAVRLPRPPVDTIAARAAALNLRLYVDLPAAFVPADKLDEVLTHARPVLDRIRALAREYESVTHVGLARSADTTVPAACSVLAHWTDRIHAQNVSLDTYYVTPFSATADQCAGAVDRVLLDTRGVPRPAVRWTRWHSREARPGLGALGTWVRPDAPPGLQVPHSPDQQARHLERVLSQLLDTTRTPPPTVFVARWQDHPSPLLSNRQYGLHTADGSARPAAAVVRGFYTGTQRTFAFPSGSAPAGSYGLLLLGWGLIAFLGGVYAQSLFVRETVARFFTAHGFYRDAIREGRDLNPATNGLLLGVVTASLGVTGVQAARVAMTQPSTERVLAALPEGLRTALAGGLEHPATVGIVIAGTLLVLFLTWMVALVVAARRWTRFSVAQGLVLLVWPCWPALGALPVALATNPHSPVSGSVLALFLLGGTVLTLFYFTVRVVLDYRAVTGVPWSVVVLLSTLSPFTLTLGSFAAVVWQYDVPLLFLWRLVTLTS